ncbi:hypothetical protein MPNT_90044 [Candidatus Methylacidithermus pantelleriae]|uniref:Uncharacterized protein n=1 Tax=Candidatus Methylacidithermus pantelleriae TaxID=2744239 RepID=A0A8J2BWS9_9BACT|nr:hypothetical protein MPNT_90044 [Candidatus Methylacidithermus pantelleriae]
MPTKEKSGCVGQSIVLSFRRQGNTVHEGKLRSKLRISCLKMLLHVVGGMVQATRSLPCL